MKPNVPCESTTAKIKTSCGSLYITTVFAVSDGAPISVLLQLGKAGGCAKAHLSVLSEYINHTLRSNYQDTVLALSSISGIKCSEGDSCIGAAVNYLLEIILKHHAVVMENENG